jgi:hypothetical protein
MRNLLTFWRTLSRISRPPFRRKPSLLTVSYLKDTSGHYLLSYTRMPRFQGKGVWLGGSESDSFENYLIFILQTKKNKGWNRYGFRFEAGPDEVLLFKFFIYKGDSPVHLKVIHEDNETVLMDSQILERETDLPLSYGFHRLAIQMTDTAGRSHGFRVAIEPALHGK